ncbi:MAG: hypothetical protein QXF01_02170 [Candidatus Micrarchaeaceae archaeon]
MGNNQAGGLAVLKRPCEDAGRPEPSRHKENYKVTKIIEMFFDGRYPPYGHLYEYAVGSELVLLKEASKKSFAKISYVTNIKIGLLLEIAGGLYDRESINEGLIELFGNAVNTDIKALRRVGEEAVRKGIKARVHPDIGHSVMIGTVNKDAELMPERYYESILIGTALRNEMKRTGFNRKRLSRSSGVPIEFLDLLLHGTVPSEFIGSQFTERLIGKFGLDVSAALKFGKSIICLNAEIKAQGNVGVPSLP